MAASKLVKTVAQISDAVTSAYRKVEDAVTGSYAKIQDRFVDRYLTREGESVEEAKKRLRSQQTG